MLNNNHVQLIMSIVGIVNDDKKSRGFKYLTDEEIKSVEKNIISIFNKYNRIENFFVNNPVTIFIKESFYYLFGFPYPEYLYNKESNDYVVFYKKGKNEDRKVMVEVTTTPDISRALDISKIFFVKREYMIYAINKTWKLSGGDGEYKKKRVIIYN